MTQNIKMSLKSKEYRAGYHAGYASGMRRDASDYKKGRSQGLLDMKRIIKNHFNGKKEIKWMADIAKGIEI